MAKTKVDVKILNSTRYYTNQDDIDGCIVISSDKGFDLRSIDLYIRCDVNVHIEKMKKRLNLIAGGINGSVGTSAVNTYGSKHVQNDVDESLRFYENAIQVQVSPGRLAPGSHTFHFTTTFPTIPLPPSIYLETKGERATGLVKYYLKALVYSDTKKVSKSGLTGESPELIFMPKSDISQPELLKSLRQVEFAVDSKSTGVVNKTFKKLLEGAKTHYVNDKLPLGVKSALNEAGLWRSEPARDFLCTAMIPSYGFLPNTSFDLGFKIRPVNDVSMLVRNITIRLETVMSIQVKGEDVDFLINSAVLSEKQIIKEGRLVDLSDCLTNLSLSEKLLPSFTTPVLSHKYLLSISCLVQQSGDPSGKNSVITHQIPVKVLPPSAITPQNHQVTTPTWNQTVVSSNGHIYPPEKQPKSHEPWDTYNEEMPPSYRESI